MKPLFRFFPTSLLWVLLLIATSYQNVVAQCPATITDANFADAIRTIYPALIGPAGNNTLAAAAATYAGELDFRGWGNPTLTSGANSPYATKPKLTTIEGIGCFTSLTKLNVSNQLLMTLPALPTTLTELRCSTNGLTSLPTLPAGLKVLNCFSNQLTTLPALPNGFQAMACGLNRLTALPALPASMIYLRCERQYTDAPTGTFSEAKKTLGTLPALSGTMTALFCVDNKLTTLPELPGSLAYLHVSGNPALTCLPTLPTNFFSAALPSGPYFGFSQTGGVGSIAEPRLNVSSTSIRCLPNAPAGIASAKVNPGSFGNENAVCATPPTVSITASGCSRAGNNAGRVVITATSNTTLEYSRDSLNYQTGNTFAQLPEGVQTFWVRRKDAPVACPSAVARQSVTIATAPAGFTTYTIADANFADAIRTLYPALIGPAGDNRLTEAITCFDGEVDFSGWGNRLNSNGDSSLYAARPKLTTINGVEYLEKVTSLNVMNQNLTAIGNLPASLEILKAAQNNLTTITSLPGSLDWLDISSNAFTALPTLPGSLRHLNCSNNRLTVLAELPASLKYLACQQQHTAAPALPAVLEEQNKTLTALPALPPGLRAINCSNNKLSSLPAVPDSLVYLRFFNNAAITCLPQLPSRFFTGSITSGTLAPYGLTEPRLTVAGTAIVCLAGLPAGFNTTNVSPNYFGSAVGACSTPPSLSSLVSCAAGGSPTGTVRLLALINGVSFGLEYSRDGTTYQDSSAFTGLAPGTYTFYARRKATSGACQPVVAASVSVTITACNPTAYHVSPSGNDATGDGTSGNPWKTIVYATSRVTANKGDTIRLAAGTFEESSRIVLPSGVSLIGAGKDKTFIKVNFFYDMLAYPLSCGPSDLKEASFDLLPENCVIQVNGSNQVLKGFYLDGQDKKCHGGIYAKVADRVIWDELEIRHFRIAGIWTDKSYNSQIRYCKIINSTWGNSRADFANIMFYDCDNLHIHHNEIEVNDIGAYGIKANQTYDKNTCRGGNAPERNSYVAKTFLNVKIYENSIKVPATGTWSNGTAPAITIEFPASTPANCEIYNNYLNNHVSVPGIVNATDGYQYTGKTAHIHHNIFDMGKDDGSEYRYAIEATVPNMEIDHNFFKGGLYPISMFNAGLGNDPRFTNHLIHHNIFYGARGTRNGQQPQALLNYRSLPSNFKFYNNTVVDNNGIRTLLNLAVAVPRYNAEIINNIFVSPEQNRGKLFTDELYVNPVFKRNLFYNIDAFGTDSLVVDSTLGAGLILTLSGDKPRPYFELTEESPAINAGVVIAGITDGFVGTAPDLGAYESQGQPISISQQPASSSAVCAGASVSVSVTVDGPVQAYQWYKDGAVLTGVASATAATLSLSSVSSSAQGSYRVVVTGFNSLTSTVFSLTVNNPLTASAGASQTITAGSTASLAANSPTSGTGSWSVVSGPSTSLSQFSNPNSAAAQFTSAGGAGIYKLEWTISQLPCSPSSSQVLITVSGVESFAISGVTTVSCEIISTGEGLLRFTPQYVGLSGQPVSFSVVNEMLPTTAPGPYTLRLYTDNPTIALRATQTGTAGQASFSYNWLSVCNSRSGGRLSAATGGEPSALRVVVQGNPIQNELVKVEVRGAEGESLRLLLSDGQGRVVAEHSLEQAGAVEQYQLPAGRTRPGLLLLRVSTPTQSQTLKLLQP